MSYPIVECPRHGDQSGYAICRHLLDGALVAHLARPTATELGAMLCRRCVAAHAERLQLLIICTHCAAPLLARVGERVH